MNKTALVIPTVRKKSFDLFFLQWKSELWMFDHIIVVEDSPTRTFEIKDEAIKEGKIKHVSWQEIDENLGDNAWIISRKDSAIRSYGFYLAYHLGADLIYTVDDDCENLNTPPFVYNNCHRINLTDLPKWTGSIPGVHTIGMPYNNLGRTHAHISMGLWTGNTDYDAIHRIKGAQPITNLPETRVMPLGQYFPMCGMNLAFRREATPLMYFPLMGEGQPYSRFDDIWCGIIAKKICDHLGWLVTVGKPYLYHRGDSDPFDSLVKEAPGIKANETFWEIINEIKLEGLCPIECMKQVGFFLNLEQDLYLSKLGGAMMIWADLFANP